VKPLLDVVGLSKSFGNVRAVHNLEFQVDRGMIWGFIGPNGAGKTTTMRILSTLELPDTGNAFIDGTSILIDPLRARMRIGFMADHFFPYANLDVGQYLDFFARLYGLVGAQRVKTLNAVIDFCGLGEFVDRPATGLSKGMGQRVHLAKTLLHDPDLLILDEPANGLDPRARIEFRDLLKLLAERGKAILISSHILSELSEICHGALVVERGERIVSGSIEELSRGATRHIPVRVRAIGGPEALERFLLLQPKVFDLEVRDGAAFFGFDGDESELAPLLARAVGEGLAIVEFSVVRADLEHIFLKTTKGQLQ